MFHVTQRPVRLRAKEVGANDPVPEDDTEEDMAQLVDHNADGRQPHVRTHADEPRCPPTDQLRELVQHQRQDQGWPQHQQELLEGQHGPGVQIVHDGIVQHQRVLQPRLGAV